MFPTNIMTRNIPWMKFICIPERPGIYCPLDNGKHTNSDTTTTADKSLGHLERLPLELINMVLMQLDIRSLTDFRRVNRRAMQTIDNIPQYGKIVTHAPISLQGTLSIGSGRYFSCQDLYKALCTANCETCGKTGGYLYLITCRRVCFQCFTQRDEYQPLLWTDVSRKFGISRQVVNTLPSMRSLPGSILPR